MGRNGLRRAGLLLLVIVLVAASCGGDDGGSSEEGTDAGSDDSAAISEDDWVDEVSDLCGDWSEEVDEVDGADADDVADLAQSTERFGEDIEDLGEPEDIADEADEFVDVLGDVADFLDALAEAVDDFEVPDSDDVQAGNEASDALVELGEDLDLDCDLTVLDGSNDDDDFGGDASSDFSDDASDDFSDDFSDDAGGGFPGDALDPSVFITEFGSDPTFDQFAVDCFEGDFAACDQLYLDSPIDESIASYEGYGATCGGRLPEEQPNQCVQLAGG